MSALAGHRPKRQVKRKWLSLLDGVPRRLLPTLEPVGRPMGARATVFRRGTTWTGMTTVIEVPPSELAAETAAGSTLAVVRHCARLSTRQNQRPKPVDPCPKLCGCRLSC